MMTKRAFYETIANNETLTADVREYATNAIAKMDETLANRSSKQKKKTAEENAPFVEKILEVLRTGPKTTSEIAGLCEMNSQKVSPICRNLVEEGILSVADVKVPKKGMQKQYSIVAVLAAE